jgi:hypothetical protein
MPEAAQHGLVTHRQAQVSDPVDGYLLPLLDNSHRKLQPASQLASTPNASTGQC